MKKIMKYFAIFILTSVVAGPACAVDDQSQTVTTPAASPTTSAYQAYVERAEKRSDETHEKNMALLQRTEKDIERQEADWDRFEKILATWERQQAEYQTYLDSLKHSDK